MTKSLRSLLFGIASLFVLTVHAQEYPFRNPDLPISDRVQDLISRLTLEEKAAQMQNLTPAIERLGIPAYNWWNECLHGVGRSWDKVTVFPQAIAMAATFDPEALRQMGSITSTEARAIYNEANRTGKGGIQYKGLTFWTPNINIFRDPRWGRGHETFGEDPVLTEEMGCAYVRGLQGEGETLKSAACAKHFAVHSGPEALRHSFDAKATKKDMHETYLPAFKALVQKANVESVMGAYNRTNGEPCCASRALMVDLLRGEWGFEGHYVSDCWAVRDFHENHKVTEGPQQSTALALSMGCDVNCGCTYQHLLAACKNGLIDESYIRTSAVRLFTTRYLLGIMPEQETEFDKIPYTAVECKAHIDKAHEASVKSCVLLKNDGMLPLDMEKIQTLGVIGPNANSRVSLIGNYHGTSSRYITVLEGLQDALCDTGVRVLYSEGCHLFRDRVENLGQPGDRLSEALTVAENADAVVLVVGLDETLEGEEGDTGNADASGDKLSLLLPESQRKLMDAVLSAGKPTVIVLMAGSAIDLQDAGEKANAVLLPWYPGARGGKAVAEILLGKASPSGKLPVTFYRNAQLDEMPAFTDYAMKGRTYRYVENEPLYPFGYGLTYGDVSVTAAKAKKTDDGVTVSVTARNGGSVDTQEVIEVYCQNAGSENAPRNPRLCAFARVSVPAGESVTAELAIPGERLMVVGGDGRRVTEGELVFYAGVGQPDALTERLTGHKAVSFTL